MIISESSMIGMARLEMWTPQNAKDIYWQQAQDSTFFILVIQDHVESIGKPILLEVDKVLLNGLLAQSA